MDVSCGVWGTIHEEEWLFVFPQVTDTRVSAVIIPELLYRFFYGFCIVSCGNRFHYVISCDLISVWEL
jgi:hypothetical protein